jgi:hypothetical protein
MEKENPAKIKLNGKIFSTGIKAKGVRLINF